MQDLYFDQQTVTVAEVTSPYGLKPWEFEHYVSISLHEDAVVDPNEIVRVVEEANLSDPTAYTVDDIRRYTEWGASGAVHDVLITVAAGVACGAATTITSRLLEWLKDRHAEHDKHIDLGEAVKLSETFLRDSCKVSGGLELLSSELGEREHILIWHSNKTKSTFSVYVSRNGRIIRASRRSN